MTNQQQLRCVIFLLCSFFFTITYGQSQPISAEVTAFAFTPDNQKMVSGHKDGSIMIWNSEGKLILNKKPEFKLESYETNRGIEEISISPDGERIIAHVGYKYYLLDKSGNVIKSFGAEYAGFSNNNQSIYAISRGNNGTAYDYSLNEVNKLSITYDEKNNKDEPAQLVIHGVVNKANGGIIYCARLKYTNGKIYTVGGFIASMHRLRLTTNSGCRLARTFTMPLFQLIKSVQK
jgi:hypothetical protein